MQSLRDQEYTREINERAKALRTEKLLKKVFIGDVGLVTHVTFGILTVSSIPFLISYSYIYLVYWKSICDLKLHSAIGLFLFACILNTIAGMMGQQFLRKAVVSNSKLFSLHAVMLLSIVIHLFIPLYHLSPKRLIKTETDDPIIPKFQETYWDCTNSDLVNCNQVYTLGTAIWCTIISFLILLTAWRFSLCHRPHPVVTEGQSTNRQWDRISGMLTDSQESSSEEELTQIYRRWDAKNNFDKPYMPHYCPQKSYGKYEDDHHTVMDMNMNF